MHAHRQRRRRRGNAFIEFALIWGVLFPVIGGTAQFGNAFYQYNKLCSAVRNAARFAAVQTYESVDGSVPVDFRDAVRNVVRYGNPAPQETDPVVVNVDPANIAVSVIWANRIPSVVSVSVTRYDIDTIFKTFTIQNKPETRFPYLGRWDPVIE